jgi:protein tyrosine phosphatase (PTP) superfamily phosphohydrolase (DUF442 family)
MLTAMREPRFGRGVDFGLKIGLIVVLAGLAFLYWTYGQYRVTPVREGVFYHSAAMPPERLQEVVADRGIKTVIDFRFQTAKTAEEQSAMQSVGVGYHSLPSRQVPTDETIEAFIKIISNPDNFPVLVHCHHGEGRAPLFGALYRIEALGWEPEAARRAAKPLSFRGDFAPDGSKGKFLRDYQRRSAGDPQR